MGRPAAPARGIESLDAVERDVIRAVFLLMAEQDIPRIRIADVLKLAGVSRSTFYRRFSSVDAVVKRFEDALLQTIDGINSLALKTRFGPEEVDVTGTMVARMETLLEHRDQIVALNGPHGDPAFRSKATEFMHRHMRSRLGVTRTDSDDLDLYLAFVIAGHHDLVQFWLERRPDIPPERVASAINRLFYAPFFLDGHRALAKPAAQWLD